VFPFLSPRFVRRWEVQLFNCQLILGYTGQHVHADYAAVSLLHHARGKTALPSLFGLKGDRITQCEQIGVTVRWKHLRVGVQLSGFFLPLSQLWKGDLINKCFDVEGSATLSYCMDSFSREFLGPEVSFS
jgi:hypothetical protein